MSSNPVLAQLRQRIDGLEETRRRFSRVVSVADIVDRALPHGGLPTGCIHEIKARSLASAIAFSAILAARIAQDRGNILYIGPDRSQHPLGLLPYGVKLEQLLYISIRKASDLGWAVMESLRCRQVSAVIAAIDGLDLTSSRRLQLAAEASRATGFLIGRANSAPSASPITRWKVSAIPGKAGQRFDEPMWTLELLYCRGGRPGKWALEWRDKTLSPIPCTQLKQQMNFEALAG